MSEEISLIWATQGEYSDRQEWPVVAMSDAGAAQARCERLNALFRELCTMYEAREDELRADGDLIGATLYESTDEGREFVLLGGGKPSFQKPLWIDLDYTCARVLA
jgi:hypothetical protein